MDPWAKNPYILYQVDSANRGGITHERLGGMGGGGAAQHATACIKYQ